MKYLHRWAAIVPMAGGGDSEPGRKDQGLTVLRGCGMTLGLLKRGLLAFWAVWLTVVCITNALDACKALGVLGDDWSFARGTTTWWPKPPPGTGHRRG
jgi:hypothetical protein